MAKSLSGSVSVNWDFNYQVPGDIQTGSAPLRSRFTTTYTNGAGAGAAEVVISDTRTLTTGATENLDFAGGFTDAFGVAVTFTKIKHIGLYAHATNTTNLTIGGTPTPDNPLPLFGDKTDTITLVPGAPFTFGNPSAAGIAVGAGATDLLLVTNAAGASASYDIVVIGEE